MRVSRDELLCFNSMLDQKRIFGVNPEIYSKKSALEYIETCKKELREHGFLTKEEKLNKSFVAAALLLKEYKRADYYLMINKARIAFSTENANIVYLQQEGKEFEFGRKRKDAFLYALFCESSFLRQADQGTETIARHCTKEEWQRESQNKIFEELYWIQKVTKEYITDPIVLYHIGESGYCYDMGKEQLLSCGGLEMRTRLLKLFQIKLNKGENMK